MATASIFDCDSVDALDLPRRQLVTYDDDDLFSFGCDASPVHDEIDKVTKNLRIKVTIDNIGDESHRKRHRYIDYDNDDGNDAAKENFHHEPKKKRISNVQSTVCDATPVASTSRDALTEPTENRTKTPKYNNEPYKLDLQIGEGTYGQVYKGHCTQTNTVIAIKRLKCMLNTPNTVRCNRSKRRRMNFSLICFSEFLIFHLIFFSGRQESTLDFIKREYENLMELQDCQNVVRLYKGREQQLRKNELIIDLLFEYCPYDLKKLILNRHITFRLDEIKSFMRQMLLGLREIHSKSVSF